MYINFSVSIDFNAIAGYVCGVECSCYLMPVHYFVYFSETKNVFLNVIDLSKTIITLQLKVDVVLERVDIFCGQDQSNKTLCGQHNGRLEGTVEIETLQKFRQDYAPNVLLYYYEVKTDYFIINGTIRTTGQGERL